MLTSVTRVGGKIVLKVHEDIMDMKSGEDFKEALMRIYDEGEKEVVLDLREVNLVNSHGIGKILMFYKRFQEAGGQMYMAPLQGSIKETFESLMLDKLIPSFSLS